METITEPLSAIENDNSGTKENWIPVLVGILLSIIVVFLWWTLNNQEKTHLQNKMEEESQKLISYRCGLERPDSGYSAYCDALGRTGRHTEGGL